MPDITKTHPDKKEKNLRNSIASFLFYLVQWTWGLPVNLVGGIALLVCTKIKKRRYQRFGYSYIVYLPWKSGGLSLGLFIFMKDQHKNNGDINYIEAPALDLTLVALRFVFYIF